MNNIDKEDIKDYNKRKAKKRTKGSKTNVNTKDKIPRQNCKKPLWKKYEEDVISIQSSGHKSRTPCFCTAFLTVEGSLLAFVSINRIISRSHATNPSTLQDGGRYGPN